MRFRLGARDGELRNAHRAADLPLAGTDGQCHVVRLDRAIECIERFAVARFFEEERTELKLEVRVPVDVRPQRERRPEEECGGHEYEAERDPHRFTLVIRHRCRLLGIPRRSPPASWTTTPLSVCYAFSKYSAFTAMKFFHFSGVSSRA